LPKPDDSETSRLDQLTKLVAALPEAATNVVGRKDEHRQFVVGKKTFGYYLHHHHNDGVIGLCAKVPPGENSRLVGENPKRFYIPAYLGPSGWVGVRLDLPKVNWAEIEHLLLGSYVMQAGKKLAAKVTALTRD
jgi:hypothetical protein